MLGQTLLDVVENLPKIELHRHLEGSVRIETLVEIAHAEDHELKSLTTEDLRPYVQMAPGQPFTAATFLSKFNVLRQFYTSPETIQRITRETIMDAARDNVRYMELRFTPKALLNVLKCSYEEVVLWVCEATQQACAEYDIEVGLLVSMNRHEGIDVGHKTLDVAVQFRDAGVVGIDLAGKEHGYSCVPFAPLFAEARQSGLSTTIHAGEWAGASSVFDAVEHLQADRIGHGIRALEDPDILALLQERGTVLEVCPTSNLHSGVVPELRAHPLRALFDAGVKTTINTDDPLISNITLTTEMLDVMLELKFTLNELKQHVLVAAESAFLPESRRRDLVTRFEKWFADVPSE